MERRAPYRRALSLKEMTNHEWLDKNHRKERTTFADGTVVTADWDARTAAITPDLPAKK